MSPASSRYSGERTTRPRGAAVEDPFIDQVPFRQRDLPQADDRYIAQLGDAGVRPIISIRSGTNFPHRPVFGGIDDLDHSDCISCGRTMNRASSRYSSISRDISLYFLTSSFLTDVSPKAGSAPLAEIRHSIP